MPFCHSTALYYPYNRIIESTRDNVLSSTYSIFTKSVLVALQNSWQCTTAMKTVLMMSSN
nr:MAG TPA: hypothetical protein [Caudoviricetes sp.]